MTKLELMAALLLLLVLLLAWIAERATKNDENQFNFAEMFIGQSGKNSLTNLGKFTAIIISGWAVAAVIVTEQSDSLIEFTFGSYLAAWVTDSVANKITQRK